MPLSPPDSPTIPALLEQGMGPDLHWFPESVSPTTLAEVMVGMANTARHAGYVGGTILLGIAPRSARVQGVQDVEEGIDRVFQAAMLTDPPMVLPMPEVHSIEGMQVIRVLIPTGLPHVYSLDGRYLGRDRRYTNPLPARKLRQLLLERGIVHFESRVPQGATLDDLDFDQVSAYLEQLTLPGKENPLEILLRRGCLIPLANGDNGSGGTSHAGYAPTYAAMILFGKQPQRWLPNALILGVRFAGTSFADQFIKQEIGGTLPQQLRRAEQFVRDELRSVVRLVGLAREETLEYPLEAVRELLVNAVAHRDYNVQGDSVHLHLFANRLEIHSPGGLPGPVTLDNLLEARFSRNPVIVQVLSDMGYIERLGYGLDRVVAAMRRLSLPQPRFEETAGTFRVTLLGETKFPEGQMADLARYQGMNLNDRQQTALKHLTAFGRITNSAYQDLCPNVSPETLRRDLVELVQRGVLIKIGDRKATYYILK
ncbi:MAG: ATP-binding protein [Anaerolineales bacterium]